MSDIFVFAPDADDFGTFGLVGALIPTKCEHEEVAGGMSQITLEHPLDELGRHRMLKPGYILQCRVPVRTTPEIDGTRIVTSVEVWTVSPLATKVQCTL